MKNNEEVDWILVVIGFLTGIIIYLMVFQLVHMCNLIKLY
jgi:hypothetical protein